MADPVLRASKTPHFFQPLLPGFESHLNIPVAFSSEYLKGRNEYKTAILRSDASDKAWEVKIEAGRRLSRGWKEFTTAHDFRIGDIIIFRHEGDMVFHVTALGPNCNEIEYTKSYNIDDDSDDHQENIEIRSVDKRAKQNPRREEGSSSENSCFVANVSSSNLYNDKVYVPISFVRSNALKKTYGKIVLLNEMERSWKLSLDHEKSGGKTYLRHGWRSFCNANGINQGHCTFKLVQNSGTPVLRLCQAGYRPDAESSSDQSCFVGSLTPSSIRNDALYLPLGFVRSNGLKETCCDEIVLKNEHGGTWNLALRHYKSNNKTVVTQGWRSFCQANGIKAKDTFMFKLARTGPKPVLYLFSAEASRGDDVNSISTDPSKGEESMETEESEEENTKYKGRDHIIVKEEESMKDKSSLRKGSNIKKSKSCSRPGASSSSSQNRFVTLTITPYSFKSNKLIFCDETTSIKSFVRRLPRHFTRVNGINQPGKIILLGQDGIKRMVSLLKDNTSGIMNLGRDWKAFSELHGVRIGESFVLELIRKKDAGPVLKFCSKLISV